MFINNVVKETLGPGVSGIRFSFRNCHIYITPDGLFHESDLFILLISYFSNFSEIVN